MRKSKELPSEVVEKYLDGKGYLIMIYLNNFDNGVQINIKKLKIYI
jgi:hypothetical protein